MSASHISTKDLPSHPVEPIAAVPGIASEAVWLTGGAAILDAVGKVISVNEPLAIWLGASRGELPGQSFPTLMGQRCPEWEQPMRDSLERALMFDRLELAVRNERGQQKIAVELCSYQQTQFVRLESVLPPVRDLEEIFPAEYWGRAAMHSVFNRLIRAEAQLENLVERWPGIVFSQRPDFSFAFISPRIEELTGMPAQEWRRQTKLFWQMIHEADTDALMERLKQLNDSPEGVTSTYRIRHLQTGRVTYLWEHRQPVRSSNGLLLGYEGIWLDITRQTIAERRLLNMAWKENLGTLSMGLAHDFRNIMTGIIALSETFENQFKENETLHNGLGLIRSTAVQAGELARRIGLLHQGKPGEKNYHDLNEIVSNLADVLQTVLARRLQVKSELAPGQLPIYADAVELRQVIVNLALNAADAMPDGGVLTFCTARCEEPPVEKPIQGKYPRAPLVCFSVQDSGVGIPAHHLNSIFDPFFTTKPLAKGSGLGLYNTRLFAENHGVAISVDSRHQVGTTFHLWFAQSDFSESQQLVEVASPARRILLVAGEPGATRDRTVELLRGHGFYAVPADAGAEALEALHSPDYDFSGVLLLSAGRRAEETSLFQRIRSEKLTVKTFLSVIGCNPDELETSLLQNADALLPQDLPPPELVSRIKAVLDRR
jgi:PAS domain S-box-containing protein